MKDFINKRIEALKNDKHINGELRKSRLRELNIILKEQYRLDAEERKEKFNQEQLETKKKMLENISKLIEGENCIVTGEISVEQESQPSYYSWNDPFTPIYQPQTRTVTFKVRVE